MNRILLGLYGLKYNPFTPDVPTQALYLTPGLEKFIWRVENHFIHEGGFAMISGEPGTGKSVGLRLLAERLKGVRDSQIGILTHTSGRIADFYRELGEQFEVPLNVHNRWHSFKCLRERWIQHMKNTLLRPILFIDEAQEMPTCVLNELRLMMSEQFDSRLLISVILAGDNRLLDKLRRDDLAPLGSRIRVRMRTEYATVEELKQMLMHLLTEAGNPNLMTTELITTLCEHAMGNYRALCTMGAELLAVGAQEERAQLDEKLYLDCFAMPAQGKQKRITSLSSNL